MNKVMDDVKSGYKDLEEKTLQSVSNAKDNAVTWVEEGVSKIKDGTHQVMDNVKDTVDKTVKSVDKNVTQGMTQYNKKAQELADKLPGRFGDKVLRYPWVAITVSLFIGIGLGLLIKPGRKA